MLDATGDAMAMLDRAGRLVFANQAYEKLLDLPEAELRSIAPRELEARFRERFREPDLREVEGGFLLDNGNVVETTGAGQVPEQRLFYRSTAVVRDGDGDGDGEEIGSLVVYRGRVQGDRGRADEGRGAAPA